MTAQSFALGSWFLKGIIVSNWHGSTRLLKKKKKSKRKTHSNTGGGQRWGGGGVKNKPTEKPTVWPLKHGSRGSFPGTSGPPEGPPAGPPRLRRRSGGPTQRLKRAALVLPPARSSRLLGSGAPAWSGGGARRSLLGELLRQSPVPPRRARPAGAAGTWTRPLRRGAGRTPGKSPRRSTGNRPPRQAPGLRRRRCGPAERLSPSLRAPLTGFGILRTAGASPTPKRNVHAAAASPQPSALWGGGRSRSRPRRQHASRVPRRPPGGR